MVALFSFKGRTNRLGYLGMGVVQGLVLGVAAAVAIIAFKGGHPTIAVLVPVGIVFAVLGFVTIWLGLAVMARRLRDMGLPAGPSLGVILAVSTAAQLARLGHHGHDAFTPMALLFGGLSALAGFALLFWPSARADGPDERELDDIFGEAAAQPDRPALIKAPSRLLPSKKAQPAEPAERTQPVFRPAPQVAGRDASGRIVPRAQFGLKGQTAI